MRCDVDDIPQPCVHTGTLCARDSSALCHAAASGAVITGLSSGGLSVTCHPLGLGLCTWLGWRGVCVQTGLPESVQSMEPVCRLWWEASAPQYL